MCTILTDRVAIAAGMVEKLDQVVAGDNAGGDDIGEGGHLGGRRGGRGGGEAKSDGWMVEVLWLLECYSKRGKTRVPSNGSVAMCVFVHI